jgi:hypothetical protein
VRRAFDEFTVVHAGLGAAMGASGVPPWLAIGSHVLYEALEDDVWKPMVEEYWPDAGPDSLRNHLGDLAGFTAGYYGARRYRTSAAGQVAIASLVGLAAALWIYDVQNRELWLPGGPLYEAP